LLDASVHAPVTVTVAIVGTRTGHEVGTLPAVELAVHVAAAEGRRRLAVAVLLDASKTSGGGKTRLPRRTTDGTAGTASADDDASAGADDSHSAASGDDDASSGADDSYSTAGADDDASSGAADA
jgi:hypothetical protein